MRRLGLPFRRSEAATVVGDGPPVVEEEEVAPPPPPPRRPLLWPWLLLLLALVAGGLVALWLLTRDDGDDGASTVNVPNVIRLRQEQAVARLNDRGLVARVVTRASAAEAGRVVRQEPGPGADVTRRSVVRLTVSAVRQVAVPNVVGGRAAEAVDALRERGLRVRTVSVTAGEAPGTVVAQSPGAGDRVARGSTVRINVSRGLVTVPQTVGQSRDTAVAAIRGAGLVPEAFTVPSTQEKGTVVAQSPAAGKRVPGGSSVRLNISNGRRAGVAPPPPPPPSGRPAVVTVPDVTGQEQEAAQKQLNVVGLKAGVVYVPSDEAQGTVVAQSPEAGLRQRRGTRVQINVSLGPDPGSLRAVPDVLGLSAAEARTRLEGAGFEVQTLRQDVSDAAEAGQVVDEQPSGGRRAPAGSTVTIYVGRRS